MILCDETLEGRLEELLQALEHRAAMHLFDSDRELSRLIRECRAAFGALIRQRMDAKQIAPQRPADPPIPEHLR